MPVQYIDGPAGRLVVLPEAEYREMAEMLADADAAALIDRFRAKLAAGEEELIPADAANRLLAGESPVRVWRELRGLKTGELAERAGLSQAFVSQIETGKREGSVGALKALAEALGVTLDDLA